MIKHLEEKNRFLHDYGCDGLKIIASYEDAVGTEHDDCYTSWFGDMNLFEAAAREDITYDMLYARYMAALKYLGIIHDQVKTVCSKFLSSQLADHIRAQIEKSDMNAEYVPASILQRIDTFELTQDMLRVDADMDVDCDIGQEITVCFETWFDVDKKFGTHISDEDGTWLNMYGKYNPFEDTLRIECEISRDNGSEYFDYEPTAAEARLMKSMITEKIMETHGQTPRELCCNICDEAPTMGGIL